MSNEESYFLTRLFWSDSSIVVSYISLLFSIATFIVAKSLKKSLRTRARLTDLYRSLEADREKLKSALITVPNDEINYTEVNTINSSLVGRLKASYAYLPKEMHGEIKKLIKKIEDLNKDDFNENFDAYTMFNSLITQIDEINKDNSWR